MKNWIKKLSLVFALVLCLSLTACGGDSKSAESTESEKSSTISPLNDPSEGLGDIVNGATPADFSMYEGVWLPNEENEYDSMYMEFDTDGWWVIVIDGEQTDNGCLYHLAEDDCIYLDSAMDGAIDGGKVTLDGDQMYITTLGSFTHVVSEENQEYDTDTEVFHNPISMFEGTWYFDNDLAATMFIVIDGEGNWRFYQRASGDPEATEMDYGTLSYNEEEDGAYYADSAMYDNLRMRMYDQDEGVIVWNEDTFYRIDE